MEQLKTILIKRVPDSVFKEFKSLCALKGVSIKNELVGLMINAILAYREHKGKLED